MFAAVLSRATDKFEIIGFKGQGGFHLQVCQPPVPVLVIQIIGAILQKDPNGFPVGFSNHRFVIVPSPDIRETSNMAQDFAEPFGMLPRRSERTDPTA